MMHRLLQFVALGFAVLALPQMAHADTFDYSYTISDPALNLTFAFSFVSPSLITTAENVYSDPSITSLSCTLDSKACTSLQFTFSSIVDEITPINTSQQTVTVGTPAGGFRTVGSQNLDSEGATGNFTLTDVPGAVTPEPSALILTGTGVIAAVGAFRRRVLA